ncbi:serine hydroxymethyltransferase [Patescibacteria group bacterium]|nr:serine hydroxymethyltransferase [Patescibacteria group bacterium]
MQDKKIYNLIKKEKVRQKEKLVMIASENYTSKAVRSALSSVLTHKYSEGEPGKRYYQGNEFIDEIELLACERALKIFNLSAKKWHVNCKAVSASIANLAVISGLLEPGQKILAMDLTHGGHLSHGWKSPSGKPISFISKIFDVSYYGVEKKTGKFDYNKVAKKAQEFFKNKKPARRSDKESLQSEGGTGLIISGGTAYARDINYKKMSEIAYSVGAYYLADIAHEAGLIAGKALKSPFPYADVVTMSTQKTLRGPRGAIIICKQELKNKIDRAIFPGLQGGPFNHVIASIAVCLKETQTTKFKKYAKQTIKNTKVLAKELQKYKFNIVSGGTDKHLILIDLRDKNINGHDASVLLDKAGLVCNKNTVPFETGSPMKPSGIRLGTPAITTRGMKEKEMKQIALWIKQVLIEKRKTEEVLKEVKKLTGFKRFKIEL